MAVVGVINGVIEGARLKVQQAGHPLDGQSILISYQHPGVNINDGDLVTCQHVTHPTYGDVAHDPQPIKT